MSWNVENAGTVEQVTAAIDEAVNGVGGNAGVMPASVGTYLKDAIASIVVHEHVKGALVYVKSYGHRPIAGCGAGETCEVKLLKSGPWDLGK